MEEREEFLADVRYRLEQAQAMQKLHYDKVHRHVATRWVTGRSFASDSMRRHRFPKLSPASSSHVSSGRTVSSSGSTTPPSASPCRLEPAFTMCSTWGCSRSSRGQRRPLPHPYRLCIMVQLPLSQNAPCVPVWLAGYVRFLSSGRASRQSATWEDVESFRVKYPEFQLEDELLLDGGRDVMVGHTYSRRRRARDVRRDAEHAERARGHAGRDHRQWLRWKIEIAFYY
jgi:hypothetical protein